MCHDSKTTEKVVSKWHLGIPIYILGLSYDTQGWRLGSNHFISSSRANKEEQHAVENI